MKKRFIQAVVLFFAVTLLLVTLAACGGSGSQTTTTAAATTAANAGDAAATTQAAADEPVTITWWHRGSSTEHYVNKFIVPEYNKLHPNVTIDAQLMGNDYANSLRMAIAAGTGPDMFEVGTGLGYMNVTAAAEAGQIQSLQSLMNDPELDIINKMEASLLELKKEQYNGEMYCFPMYKAFYLLVVNKDLFAKAGLDVDANPPTTFQEVASMAKTISDAGNGEFYGFGLHLGQANILYRTIDMMESMAGGGLYGFNYNTNRFDFTPHKEYMDIFAQMKKDGGIMPGESTTDVEMVRTHFNQGKIAMYIDGSWAPYQYDTTQMQNDFEWGLVNMPTLEGKTKSQGYGYYNMEYCISSTTEYTDICLDIYKFMILNELKLMTDFALAPAAYTADPVERANATYKYNGEKIEWLIDNADNYTAFQIEPHTMITLTGDNRDIVMNNALVNTFAGDNIDFDALIQDLNTRYNAALDQALSDGTIKAEDLVR